jgi:hypothetical protein
MFDEDTTCERTNARDALPTLKKNTVNWESSAPPHQESCCAAANLQEDKGCRSPREKCCSGRAGSMRRRGSSEERGLQRQSSRCGAARRSRKVIPSEGGRLQACLPIDPDSQRTWLMGCRLRGGLWSSYVTRDASDIAESRR